MIKSPAPKKTSRETKLSGAKLFIYVTAENCPFPRIKQRVFHRIDSRIAMGTAPLYPGHQSRPWYYV